MSFSSSKKTADSKHACSSFSVSSHKKSSTNMKSLTREFFGHLIKIESQFHSQKYTVATLDELVQLYAKAVEYYDSIQDEIASYFTFKIQDILATRHSLQILLSQSQKPKQEENHNKTPTHGVNTPRSRCKSKSVSLSQMEFRKTIKETIAEDSSDDESEDARRKDWERKKENNQKQDKSLATLKSERQKFVQFFQRVEMEKANQEQDMHTVFNGYVENVKDNDKIIQTGLNSQKQRLQQKIAQRKNQKIVSYSLNCSQNSLNSNKSVANNILHELEENGEADSALSETFTPALPNQPHKRALSLFARMEFMSGNKSDKDSGRIRDDEEDEEGERMDVIVQDVDSSSPVEKLSTENSFNGNDCNANGTETEISELQKLAA